MSERGTWGTPHAAPGWDEPDLLWDCDGPDKSPFDDEEEEEDLATGTGSDGDGTLRVKAEYLARLIEQSGIQQQVYAAVEARGYTKKKDGTDWPEGVFEWRQWEKALEEMREVYGYLAADPGGNQEQVMFELDLDRAVHFANTAFRNQGFVYNTSEGLHSPTKDWCRGVIEECADVVIPLLCLAETMRRRFPSLPSLMQMVAEKSAADVKRGVSK